MTDNGYEDAAAQKPGACMASRCLERSLPGKRPAAAPAANRIVCSRAAARFPELKSTPPASAGPPGRRLVSRGQHRDHPVST